MGGTERRWGFADASLIESAVLFEAVCGVKGSQSINSVFDVDFSGVYVHQFLDNSQKDRSSLKLLIDSAG